MEIFLWGKAQPFSKMLRHAKVTENTQLSQNGLIGIGHLFCLNITVYVQNKKVDLMFLIPESTNPIVTKSTCKPHDYLQLTITNNLEG
jgi:hypothetical protein